MISKVPSKQGAELLFVAEDGKWHGGTDQGFFVLIDMPGAHEGAHSMVRFVLRFGLIVRCMLACCHLLAELLSPKRQRMVQLNSPCQAAV